MSKLNKISKRQLNSMIAIGTGMVFYRNNKLYTPDFVKMLKIDIKKINNVIK